MQDPSPYRTIYNIGRAESPLNLVVANNGSRPAPRERIKTPETNIFKHSQVSPLKKVKPSPPVPDNLQAKTVYLNGSSIVRNPTIQEDSCESLTFEDVPRTPTINTGTSKAKLNCTDTIQLKKENKYRTLNTTKNDTKDDDIYFDKYMMNYSTLTPVDRPGTSLKRGRIEEVSRQNSRFDSRKDTEEYIQYELGRRRTNAEQHFPAIIKPPGPMLTEIESIYSTTLYAKSRSKSPFHTTENRKKPNGRAQSNLARRESSTRKAVSQIKAEIDRYNSTPSNAQLETSNGKVIKKLDFDPNKTMYQTREHSLTPSNPHSKEFRIPGTSNKPRSKSSLRPKNQIVFSNTEKNQFAFLNKNNSSDIYLEEYQTSYYFDKKSNKNILIEDPSKEAIKTDDPHSKKGTFSGGMPTEEHFSHPNLGKNNYIDSIEIKKDMSQVNEKDIPHWKQIKKSSGMSSPKERQGKYVRKHNSEANNKIKREESNKNILDDFAEKSLLVNEQHPTEPIDRHHRSVSKSPFDELLETSLMSYDKESMVISRTKKDLETYLKNKTNFKRSKVIVSKGHQASLEKDASTIMTISKSTFPNESQDSKEIDFGFEDDIILNKKNVKATIPSSQKQSMPLNVIHEEQQKGTINASQDLETENKRTEDNEPETPTGKGSTIKPLFFYRGKKLTKVDKPVEEQEKKEIFSDENPIDDDDDLCVNGDNDSDL